MALDKHQMLSRRDVEERAPGIRSDGLTGGASYYDARMDDARYCMATARAAAREGAAMATYVEAEELRVVDGGVVLTVRDRIADEHMEISARAAVIACGPWTDAVRERLLGRSSPVLRPTKGVHIVVPRERMPLTRSLVMRHPDDGRVVFNIPWGPATIIGTTDTDYQGAPEDCHADLSDVNYILRVANYVFPDRKVGHDDVLATYTGLRPLMLEEGVDEGATSREHAVLEDGPVFTVAGGKWTTHRRMAKDAIDRVIARLELQARPCSTANAPVEDCGSPLVSPEDSTAVVDLAALEGVSPEAIVRLAKHFGRTMIDVLQTAREFAEMRTPVVPGHAPLLAEVRFWARHEQVLTLTDALDRRASLSLVARGQGLDAAGAVARELAPELGWDPEETERQVQDYEAHISRSRAWRSEPGGPTD